MARRLARWTIWVIKGALGVVALAALVAWWASHARPRWVGVSRRTMITEPLMEQSRRAGWPPFDDGQWRAQAGAGDPMPATGWTPAPLVPDKSWGPVKWGALEA